MPYLRRRYLLPLLFVVAFCLRTPTLGLPLEGDSAELAGYATQLAEGGPWIRSGTAPLLTWLTAVAGSVGASPTAALRWIDAFLLACLAPLLLLLGVRLGLDRGRAALLGGLVAVHPLALAGAGGIDPGSSSLAACLLVAALVTLGSRSLVILRLGAGVVLALCLADAAALALAPPLLWLYARREASPRFQTAVLMLGAGLLLAAPFLWFAWPANSVELGGVGLWLLAATLGVLLPGLVPGLVLLSRRGEVAHAWLAASGAAALLVLTGGPVAAVVLLPLILVAGIEGSMSLLGAWRRRLVPAAVGGALVVSVWLVSGGLQAALLPDAPAAAGRMHHLREAMRSAATAAGERGWIVLAIADGRPDEQASLADLQPHHWTWTERAAADGGARRLHVFPAAAFESGRSVAVIAPAGREDGIHTFDGAGIFHEEVVREVGPYVVLRARRP